MGQRDDGAFRADQKCGSLKQACEQMQMSYSKGYRIIKAAEAELGFPSCTAKKGGLQGAALS